MDSVVLELCYDGWWETLENGRMEYVNGKNRAFLVGKNYLFDQLLARVYEVLQINPNKYSITMKTTLRSSNTLYRICALPMNIFNDEMVRVVLHMASDVANFGCIPIFVTTLPRVPSEGIEPHVDTETLFRAKCLASIMKKRCCQGQYRCNNITLQCTTIMTTLMITALRYRMLEQRYFQ